MSIFDFFEKKHLERNTPVAIEKMNKLVREKIKTLPQEDLDLLSKNIDPCLYEKFEIKTKVLPLSKQYEILKRERQCLKTTIPDHFGYLHSSYYLPPDLSSRAFFYLTKDIFGEFGIDVSSFYISESIGYRIYEAYEKKYYDYIYNENQHDYYRISNGVKGEQKLFDQLDTWKISEDFELLDNSVLEYNGKSFETDGLILSEFGLFSLEIKNIGEASKSTILITEDGQWLKKESNTPFSNITDQVNYHISMTEAMLRGYRNETGKEIPDLHSFIIIANEDVKIENNSDLKVYRIDTFINIIRNMERKYNMSDMKELKSWLEKHAIDEKGYSFEDFYGEFEKKIHAFDLLRQQKERFSEIFSPYLLSIKDSKIRKVLSDKIDESGDGFNKIKRDLLK